MRTKISRSLTVIVLITLALTGCRTTRQAQRLVSEQRNAMLVPLAQYPADVKFFNAKTAIGLDYNGRVVTVKGRLRMRRDDVVQMSLTALGFEIGYAEFTPKAAYIIDRVNKRYAIFDYSSGWMNLAGIDFNAVQSLFWNRLFIPGEKEAWRHVDDFTISDAGSQHRVEPSRQRMLKCFFYTDADYSHLQQADLNLQQYAAIWRYDDFEVIDTHAYPMAYDLSVSSKSHSIGAHIELSGVSTLDTGWKSSTDLSRYTQVDLAQLMSIMSLFK